MFPKLFFVSLLFSIQSQLYAQVNSPAKFGHITPQDFDLSKLTTDTTQGAVILADIGYTTFEGNNKGWFNLVYKHQRRVKIINKNGLDLADVEIALYKEKEDAENLENVKAVTYNLEEGKVVETKLNSAAVFTDKYDPTHIYKKFSLPLAKAGSIIEYSYTINSPFLFNLQPWRFQGQYPRLWSEYKVDMPEIFHYVVLSQSYQSFFLKTDSSGTASYNVLIPGDATGQNDARATVNCGITQYKWVMKDVPSFRDESFISTIENCISKIEFQLAGIQLPEKPYEDVMGNWPATSKDLLAREDFGGRLDKNFGWLNDSLKSITAGSKNDLEKARKIYYYVKNNIKSTDETGILTEHNLKDVFKNKNGSVAEVNLLLVAMLRHENITADPVILSTRDNGYSHSDYPLIDRYNYVICKTNINTDSFYLDATKQYLGFGILPTFCYNDNGRIINKDALAFPLSPDSLTEERDWATTLVRDSSSNGRWKGDVSILENFQESNNIRNEIADKGMAGYKKNLVALYSDDATVSNIDINSLDDYETPLAVNYTVKIGGDPDADIIYYTPLNDFYKQNPLKAAERKYPVEMPYPLNDVYTLNMEVPLGFEVDELPKSAKVLFNDTEGLFEYYVSKSDEGIQLRVHLKLTKASFAPEEYQDLRSFFDYVVKKCNEQFVFKKIKR